MVLAGNGTMQGRPDKFFQRDIEYLSETLVGVQNGAIFGESGGSLIYRFDHQTIGMFRALQRKDLISFGAGDEHSVNFTRSNGAQSFFELNDSISQICKFGFLS